METPDEHIDLLASDQTCEEKYVQTIGDSDKQLLNLIAEIIVKIILEEEE